jgi:hypothetical protein
MRIPQYVKELYNHILKTLGIWMFVAGIICIALAYGEVFGDYEQINGMLGSVGNAILSGGVFAVILKSLQFLGVFREELTNIIYETTYLEGRKDTKDIWKRICNVVTQGRFPDINEQVQETILETYLPHVYEYYYDGLFYGITITFADDNKTKVKVDEKLDFTLKPADSSGEYTWKYVTSIALDPGADVTTEEVLGSIKIAVEGDDQTQSEMLTKEESREGDVLTLVLLLRLKGKNEYKIAVRESRQYPLDPYNNKVFSAGRFINHAEIQVAFPPELRVVFYAMGTPREFEDRRNAGPQLISKEYKGLIFPYQGCRIVFQKR